ncbi:MAG: hypothetical protein V1694_12740 [Candidatus Eisenbacteria bacterium]
MEQNSEEFAGDERVKNTQKLRLFLGLLSYALPLTYAGDILHGGFGDRISMPLLMDFGMLLLFCVALFLVSLRSIRRRWVA